MSASSGVVSEKQRSDGRFSQDILGSAGEANSPAIQDTQPIGEPGDLVDVMGDQQHRDRQTLSKRDDFGL